MRREDGFTLVELLVTMGVFIVVIASVGSVFVPLLTQFKQQSKTAENQIEGIIGLEILRRDIKHAGFGLPWNMNGGTYAEAVNDGGTDWDDTAFNDAPADPPGAIRSEKGSTMGGGTTQYDSDMLVLKSANAALNDASQRWTLLGAGGINRNNDSGFDDENLSGNAFENTDGVIVIEPGNSAVTRRRLVLSNDAVFTSWKTAYNNPADSILAFAPAGSDINIIYGIKPDGNTAAMRFPFNRTEYYIRIPDTMPSQCAGGTGILYKSTLNHADGLHTENPVLDCVADFQVGYTTNVGGIPGIADETYTNGLTAATIRDEIRTVEVSILVQEGQKDPANCTLANPCIGNPVRVGPDTTRGRDFDFTAYPEFNTADDPWQNYRWKVYRITVSMENIG